MKNWEMLFLSSVLYIVCLQNLWLRKRKVLAYQRTFYSILHWVLMSFSYKCTCYIRIYIFGRNLISCLFYIMQSLHELLRIWFLILTRHKLLQNSLFSSKSTSTYEISNPPMDFQNYFHRPLDPSLCSFLQTSLPNS